MYSIESLDGKFIIMTQARKKKKRLPDLSTVFHDMAKSQPQKILHLGALLTCPNTALMKFFLTGVRAIQNIYG